MGERKGLPFAASATLVSLIAFLSLGISGCLQTEEQRRAQLRERAEEILPRSARLRVLDYGDCVELASSPSCAQVVFEMPERDSARRAALVRAEAERNGWTVTHSDDAQGGWSAFLKRAEYTAVVFLWRSEVYDVDCEGRPDPTLESNRFCFNTLSVDR
jgi:glutamate/tyrosine decarboxylase-like PLP-dependent enzyme